MCDVHLRLCGYKPGWNVPTYFKNVVFFLLGDSSRRLNSDAGGNHPKERTQHSETAKVSNQEKFRKIFEISNFITPIKLRYTALELLRTYGRTDCDTRCAGIRTRLIKKMARFLCVGSNQM